MLRKGRAEDVAPFVERSILQAVEEQAGFVHFELKQHYLIIRLQRVSRMKMIWRGSRGEGLELLVYLKTVSGMDPLAQGVVQAGEFPLVCRGQWVVLLPSVCKPYLGSEKVVLSLPLLVCG